MSELQARLDTGLAALGLELPPQLATQAAAYLALLRKWNKTYNLTAVRDPLQQVGLHILDSLAVLPWVRGPRLLDIGTGAGLPGLLLALARPNWECVLLDSNAKKTRFLVQASAELQLHNVRVISRRVEDYPATADFDTVISRAYTELPRFYRQACPLARPGGRVVAMKGKLPTAEIDALSAQGIVCHSEPIKIPGLDAERHVVVFSVA